MKLSERDIHFIWKYQLFQTENLQTNYGESIQILHTGTLNHNQGPDFLQAKIQIGKETFYGQVEIHLRNEDWYLHRHHLDSNYDNVILHVILEATKEIYTLTSKQTQIPILVLGDKIAPHTLHSLQYLMSQKHAIPCREIVSMPSREAVIDFKTQLFFERMRRKSAWIEDIIQSNNDDYETSFYQAMLYGFGLKVNSEAFLSLAQSLPQRYLAKHNDSLLRLEALLLGQAQLIDAVDDYSKKILEEYHYLKQLYQLTPSSVRPVFSKLLPASFPTLRLAQFAAFVHHRSGLYSRLTSFEHIDEIYPYFDIEVSDYWKTHYRFGNKTTSKNQHLSKQFVHKILINVILPFRLLASRENWELQSKIVSLYHALNPETNASITEISSSLPMDNRNAFDSQVLLEWYQQYCTPKRCLECIVGQKILGRSYSGL